MGNQKAKTQTTNKLYWIYLMGFFLILALPLLNLPPWFSPPDWGKTIVFRIILSILIFLFLYQLFSPNRYTIFSTIVEKINQNKIAFWLLIALFGVFFLANVFSLDLYFSFWGNPYRAGGFLNFSFYIIFAILAFLILRKSDWQKIWDFAIFIGILVSIIAIFQQFGILSKVFIPFSGRPPSTVGGPIFLAIYLLLLSFLALSFGIKEVKLWKKLFYFLSFLLFISVAIFITQTRAVMIGFGIGFLFFLIFYPFKNFWLSLGLKILALTLLIFGVYGVYYLNTQPKIPEFIQENKILTGVISRLSIKAGLADPRVSGWKVAKQAIMDRPILGYGPENFSIGFDKYYDPSLPQIEKMPGAITTWWDRAHNFVFDIGVTAGIPALIIYLALFGFLFFKLQRLKYADSYGYENGSMRIMAHGIQATFLAYLAANFFSFDTFSTYLISFLLIGYSLHLISINQQNQYESAPQEQGFMRIKRIYADITKNPYKSALLSVLICVLVWFVWGFNLKPLRINKEINLALFLAQNKRCEEALNLMEKFLPTNTFLNNYLRRKYVEIIDKCVLEKPELTEILAQKAVEIMAENTKNEPYDTRNWLLAGSYTNILIEKGNKNLKEKANYFFEKAYKLSPKRQETFIEWIKTDLLTGEYQKAKEKGEECIKLNEKLGDCWWLKGISEIYLGETENAENDFKVAAKNGYSVASENSFLQLAKVYLDLKDYQKLSQIYLKLIEINPSKVQYRAYLASCYKELGEFEKARKTALEILEIMPEAREDVEKFLEELPLK